MREQRVDVATADGTMPTFVVAPAAPAAGTSFPAVILYMDAVGVRDELRSMARRLATAGCCVALPDLYHRATGGEELDLMGPGGVARLLELMGSLTFDGVLADTAAVLAHLDRAGLADTSRVGCVGYGMGGPYAFAAAGTFPDRVRAVAIVNGVRLFGDGSPAELAPSVRAELYVARAERDDYAPDEMFDAFEAHLAATGVRATVERFPGTQHGFQFEQRPPVYDRDASERHWEQVCSLLRRSFG